ncbi:MAG TPA: LysE family translocator [Verrucomicrobiae bacterium]|jgi:threonine/homoserine/homoserine lactone efflux protein|nr:LysE family translocator [Verrucomicrobiae bacterium]
MPSAAHLAIFTLAALAMNAAPGPSNLYVLSRSLAQGAAGGLVSALGLALGSLFHVALAVAGLAALLSYAPTLYDAIRLAGAAYLIYLGIKTLRAPGASLPANGVARRSLARILFDAALVEMLNPKTALFFLAFLPQFVEPAAGPAAPQLLLLGLIVTLTALPCDMLVALAGARLARLFAAQARRRWPSRLAGSTLIALGLYTALMRRS